MLSRSPIVCSAWARTPLTACALFLSACGPSSEPPISSTAAPPAIAAPAPASAISPPAVAPTASSTPSLLLPSEPVRAQAPKPTLSPTAPVESIPTARQNPPTEQDYRAPEYYEAPRAPTAPIGQALAPPRIIDPTPSYIISVEPPPISTRFGPPPALSEPITPQPERSSGWIPGYWVWTGDAWAWSRGFWALPPQPAYYWIPPRYEQRSRMNFFIDGHWALREDTGPARAYPDNEYVIHERSYDHSNTRQSPATAALPPSSTHYGASPTRPALPASSPAPAVSGSTPWLRRPSMSNMQPIQPVQPVPPITMAPAPFPAPTTLSMPPPSYPTARGSALRIETPANLPAHQPDSPPRPTAPPSRIAPEPKPQIAPVPTPTPTLNAPELSRSTIPRRPSLGEQTR
jgi:hypothetical protein